MHLHFWKEKHYSTKKLCPSTAMKCTKVSSKNKVNNCRHLNKRPLKSFLIPGFERQAQDQLPGGKYATPSPEVLAQAANVPATNMASERDFGVFDLLLHLKPAARLISHETLILWTNNKTTSWLNSLSPENKQKCVAEARANTSKIMARYKERKEKIFQPQKEKLLEKQRAKEEAERKQRQRRLNLVSSITELGVLGKQKKKSKKV